MQSRLECMFVYYDCVGGIFVSGVTGILRVEKCTNVDPNTALDVRKGLVFACAEFVTMES